MSIGKNSLNAACREISKLLNDLINSDCSYLVLADGKKNLDVFSGGRKITFSEAKQKVFIELLQSIDLKLFILLIKNYLILRFMKKPWANLLSHSH